jgi:hypothetical protein
MKCLILANGFGIGCCSVTLNKAGALLAYKGKLLLAHIVNRVPDDVGIIIFASRRFETESVKKKGHSVSL